MGDKALFKDQWDGGGDFLLAGQWCVDRVKAHRTRHKKRS